VKTTKQRLIRNDNFSIVYCFWGVELAKYYY
jgi:hypothetical protein